MNLCVTLCSSCLVLAQMMWVAVGNCSWIEASVHGYTSVVLVINYRIKTKLQCWVVYYCSTSYIFHSHVLEVNMHFFGSWCSPAAEVFCSPFWMRGEQGGFGTFRRMSGSQPISVAVLWAINIAEMALFVEGLCSASLRNDAAVVCFDR